MSDVRGVWRHVPIAGGDAAAGVRVRGAGTRRLVCRPGLATDRAAAAVDRERRAGDADDAALGLGAWAAGSASFMPAVAAVVPSYIDVVTIFAHADKGGQDGARKLAVALHERGIEVRVEGAAFTIDLQTGGIEAPPAFVHAGRAIRDLRNAVYANAKEAEYRHVPLRQHVPIASAHVYWAQKGWGEDSGCRRVEDLVLDDIYLARAEGVATWIALDATFLKEYEAAEEECRDVSGAPFAYLLEPDGRSILGEEIHSQIAGRGPMMRANG